MFSQDDILDLYHLLPPKTPSQSEKLGELPLLVKTISGRSFITAHSLHHQFERLVTTKASRLPISAACSDLNVDVDVVTRLIQANPTLALLSQDGTNMILREERDKIVNDLKYMLERELVSKADLIQSCNIHRGSLERIIRIQDIKGSLVDDSEDFLLGKAYSITLSEDIRQRLKEGLDRTETIQLKSQVLPGLPPVWLIRQHLDQLSSQAEGEIDFLSQFHIEQEANEIRCTPTKSILSQRDELIDGLHSGEQFCLDIENFGRTFGELYESPKALETHFREIPSITIVGAFAVSTDRLAKLAGDAELELGNQGYADLNVFVNEEIPHEIKDAIQDNIIQRIQMVVPDGSESKRRIGNYLVTERTYEAQQQALLSVIRTQADHQWDLLKETPDKDLKPQMMEALTSIPEDKHVLRAVAQHKESEIVAAQQFAGRVSELESENEHSFNTFWTEKVSLRVHNYDEGLKSVDDAKLRDQLSELLSNYLQRDLLPDVVSKARLQGLVRSRRTRKNVNRFEATLKASKCDLPSILSTLAKFSKKQGLSEVHVEATREAKKASIHDMVRRMQKSKTDAPTMFLSLVVIIFAKHHPGLVYATGKFAPKLLKQVKTNLGGEEYEQIEKWKDQAKAGTLSKEERESMVHMAERAA